MNEEANNVALWYENWRPPPPKKKAKKKKTRGKETMQGENTKTSKDFNILLEIREDTTSGNVNRML